jgi:Holliday junction resolvase RusA-like endonuclease
MENNTVAIFFIGINVPSSKNSLMVTNTSTFYNELVTNYKKYTEIQWAGQRLEFLEATVLLPRPLHIEFTFIRKTRRIFDYVNPQQAVQDEMKHYGWIEDDNCNILKPYFGDYIYDKEFHGVLIRVLKSKPII